MSNLSKKEATREAEDAIERITANLEIDHGVRVFSFRVNHNDENDCDTVTIIPDSNGGRF